ncbi:MAG TPA: DNA polymerase III subunit gamma/tau [Acidimicrobiales bacterium]|nr:DNA polymerase III subunit gamma/tau [Acidimicrobiales bacterium]
MADAPDDVPYQSLYRRFRPSTFGEVRGQDHVVLALRNAVRDGRVAHAYLFSGPRGTGKTSTARILAKALNCIDLQDGEPCGVCASCVEITKGTSLDVHELDAASNNGVEAMRDLVSRAALGTPGRQKVYIVDEVHMLSTAASNALLKTLEEPPAHVVFVLATTDPQKVLPTIRSRTQHFEFRLLGPETLGELLAQVRQDAHLDVPDEALDLAVRRGRGSARDALSVLDQVAASDAVDDDLPELDEVVEALAERDIARALVAVAHLTSAGFSPQQLTGDLVDHLRQGFLALVAPELVTVSGAERESLASQAERVGLAALVRAMEVLGRAQVTMRDAPDPRVNLDVALVRLAHPEADDSPESILARIERLEAAGRAAPGTPSAPSAPAPSQAPGPAAVSHRPAPSEPGPTGAAGHHEAGPRSSAPGGPAVEEPPPGTTGSGRKTLGAVRRESAPARAEVAPAPPPAAPGTPPVRDEPRPPAPDAPSTPVPFPTRDQLVQAWGDHIIVGLRPKAKALFQAGRFVGVEDGRAVFGLPNDIHRRRCEEIREEIEAALSDHFGRPVGLTLVVEPGAGSESDPEESGSRDGAPTGAVTTRSSGPATPGPEQVSARRPPAAGPAAAAPAPAPDRDGRPDPDPLDDLVGFDETELEIAEVDNSAEARVLQAFPGAEEVG